MYTHGCAQTLSDAKLMPARSPENQRFLGFHLCSATFQAFEPRHGFVERRYLGHVFPVLWMRNGNLLSYGLKVHPKPTIAGAYAWCVQAEKEGAGPTA